jgi:hypothetical protein
MNNEHTQGVPARSRAKCPTKYDHDAEDFFGVEDLDDMIVGTDLELEADEESTHELVLGWNYVLQSNTHDPEILPEDWGEDD